MQKTLLFAVFGMLILAGCNIDIAPPLNETFKDYSEVNITTNTTNATNFTSTTAKPLEMKKIIVTPEFNKTITIGYFYINELTDGKMSNEYIQKALVDIIEDYDFIIIDGIKGDFVKFSATHLGNHEIIQSGPTSAYVYGSSSTTVTQQSVYTNTHNDFVKEPRTALVSFSNFEFVAMHASIDKKNAMTEIKKLDNAAKWALNHYNNNNIIIFGGLWADCLYYEDGTALINYEWVINGEMDTTTGRSDCAYDRIITTHDYKKVMDARGVDTYDDDNVTDKDLHLAISDHYPVYMQVSI